MSSKANKAAYDNMNEYIEATLYTPSKMFEGLIQEAHKDSQRWFPHVANDLVHMVLAMCGESGEVADALKKGQRGTVDYTTALENVKKETGDVLIYLLNIWAILKVDPIELLAQLKANNEVRFGDQYE